MSTRLRLSCRDNSFPVLSLPVALRVIADLGFEGADISVSDRHTQLDPAAVLADPDGCAARVVGWLAEADLVVADTFVTAFGPNTIPLNTVDEAARRTSREQFRAHVRFAAALGSPGITVLPGLGDDRAAFELAAAELTWRTELAETAGLAISVEPYQTSVVKTPEEVRHLVETVPGLGLTLDYSHFVAAGYADEDIDVLLPYARHLQVRQAKPGSIQTTAADGTIDFTRIVGLVIGSGYQGWMGCEYIWNDWVDHEVDTLAQTALLRDQILEAACVDRATSG